MTMMRTGAESAPTRNRLDVFRGLMLPSPLSELIRETIATLREVPIAPEDRVRRADGILQRVLPVMRMRVERCGTLMRTPDLPLSQIAAACGFSDQAHLNKAFRNISSHV